MVTRFSAFASKNECSKNPPMSAISGKMLLSINYYVMNLEIR